MHQEDYLSKYDDDQLVIQGDKKFLRYLKIKNMITKQVISVPFHDNTQSIEKIMRYYSEAIGETDKFTLVLAKKKIIPRPDGLIGKYIDGGKDEVMFEAHYGPTKYKEEDYEESFGLGKIHSEHLTIILPDGRPLPIKISLTKTVNEFKNVIKDKLKEEGDFMIPEDKMILVHRDEQLQEGQELISFGINRNSIIEMSIMIEGPVKFVEGMLNVFSKNKMQYAILEIDWNIEKDICTNVFVPYDRIKNKEAKDIIRSYCSNSAPYWCLIFNQVIIHPHEKVSKCFSSKSPLEKDGNFLFRIIKTAKFFFLNLIEEQPFDSKKYPIAKQNVKKQVEEKLKELLEIGKEKIGSEENLIDSSSITYYTSPDHYRNVNKFLQNLDFEDFHINTKSQYNFCCALNATLTKLPPYLGMCHRGDKRTKISSHFKEGEIYTFKQFLSTSKNEKTAMDFAYDKAKKIHRGTIYHIKSLTGKNIQKFSIYAYEEQVLFAPYSTFYIQKIVQQDEYLDHAWLSQIPSPQSFEKNIVLWVDDQPEINLKYVKGNSLEVLQITSTEMTEKWNHEFFWLMSWKGSQIRIITDMARQENETMNREAGADLIENLKKKNLQIPVIIFCGNLQNCNETLRKRGIANRATTKVKQLFEFMKF